MYLYLGLVSVFTLQLLHPSCISKWRCWILLVMAGDYTIGSNWFWYVMYMLIVCLVVLGNPYVLRCLKFCQWTPHVPVPSPLHIEDLREIPSTVARLWVSVGHYSTFHCPQLYFLQLYRIAQYLGSYPPTHWQRRPQHRRQRYCVSVYPTSLCRTLNFCLELRNFVLGDFMDKCQYIR